MGGERAAPTDWLTYVSCQQCLFNLYLIPGLLLPSALLPVETGQVKLSSKVKSRKHRQFPAPQRVSSERAFVGGGYRIDRGYGGGGGGCDRNLTAAFTSRSSPGPALADATAGILDLDAVDAAAGRVNGSGGYSGGSGRSGNAAHDHPRNRFAPMTKSEVERILAHSWTSGNFETRKGDVEKDWNGGHVDATAGDIVHGDDTMSTSLLCCDSHQSPANRRLQSVGVSTRRDQGRDHQARPASAPGETPGGLFQPDLIQLEGWKTQQES